MLYFSISLKIICFSSGLIFLINFLISNSKSSSFSKILSTEIFNFSINESSSSFVSDDILIKWKIKKEEKFSKESSALKEIELIGIKEFLYLLIFKFSFSKILLLLLIFKSSFSKVL